MNSFFRSTLVLLFFVPSIISCRSQKQLLVEKLKECINYEISQARKGIKYDKTQGIETTFESFEGYLIEKGYLEYIDKDSYYEFIGKMIQNPNEYDDIAHHISKSDIYKDQQIIFNPALFLSQCPDFVLVTEKNDYLSTLNLQHKILEGVIKSNYKDFRSIKELFTATSEKDFNELMYRIPFNYIIVMNANKVHTR